MPRGRYGKPILKARDLDATDREIEVGQKASQAFFQRIKPVMLRRNNDVIAKVYARRWPARPKVTRDHPCGYLPSFVCALLCTHAAARIARGSCAQYLPAKLDVCVFCKLTDAQIQLYQKVVAVAARTYERSQSKGAANASAFQTVTVLKKVVNDPVAAILAQQAAEAAQAAAAQVAAQQAAAAQQAVVAADAPANPFAPVAPAPSGVSSSGVSSSVAAALAPKPTIDAAEALRLSGKLQVLHSLLTSTKSASSDRFVLISNSTQTLDLFEAVLNRSRLTCVRPARATVPSYCP